MSDLSYLGPEFDDGPRALSLDELARAGDFLLTLKKVAAGDPSGWQDPLTPPQGQEAPPVAPAEGEAPAAAPEAAEAGSPAPAAAPLAPPAPADPQAGLRLAMAAAISHELRSQLAYLFYAETVRGAGRHGMADTFKDFAEEEIKDAAYLLRRMSVLFPGGVLIPPPPSPEPLTDPQQILSVLHGFELEAISKLQRLHNLVGDDPMKYTLEQMMTDEQGHADALEQLMQEEAAVPPDTLPESTVDAPEEPAPPPEPQAEPAAEPPADKVADAEAERDSMMAAANEPIDSFLIRQQNEDVQRHKAELEHTRRELEQAQAMAQQTAVELEQAQTAQQQQAAQMEEVQTQMSEAQMNADTAQATAVQAQEQAAVEAEAKMRVTMRLQQMRQMAANLASMDPVGEEGLSTGAVAGPTTPTQQAMAQQEAAMAQDPTAGTGQAPTQEAADQQQEAANAQAEAQEQTAQAQQQTTEDTNQGQSSGGGGSSESKGKPGTSVTVKTALSPEYIMAAVDRAAMNSSATPAQISNRLGGFSSSLMNRMLDTSAKGQGGSARAQAMQQALQHTDATRAALGATPRLGAAPAAAAAPAAEGLGTKLMGLAKSNPKAVGGAALGLGVLGAGLYGMHRHNAHQQKTANIPTAGLNMESLLQMAARGRRAMPVSHIAPSAPGIGAIQNLIGHRPAPMAVSAVRDASSLAGAKSVLAPGARATPGELGAALRTKTKVQGAQQLASALPMGPTPAGLAGLQNAKIAKRS